MSNSSMKSLMSATLALGAVGMGLAIYYVFLRPQGNLTAASPPHAAAPTLPTPSTATPPDVKFVDVTESAGIRFVHTNGSFGLKLLPETMGSGAAFIDYDCDGSPDILFVNFAHWPDDPNRDRGAKPTLAMYHNDGHGNFTDVTDQVGLRIAMYGMGVTVGDYDNDGFPDLCITTLEGVRLFHNEGGKKFREVTAGDLAAAKGWTTGAVFFDANNDGKLDLFVCNYVNWNREIDIGQKFAITGVGRAFGPPLSFEGTLCQLFLGDGRGGFVDVSKQSGVQKFNANTGAPMGKSLGVVACDLDRDGWMDVLVANDTVQNFYFHNLGNGQFEEIGAESGIAFDREGKARGAMGMDVAEHRGDGHVGIAIGNFANEMTALYVNQDARRRAFADRAIAEGVGPPSNLLLKFGVCFCDYDLDGRPDLFTANGHLEEDISKVQASQTYAQPPQLFWNCGTDQRVVFIEVGKQQLGDDFFVPVVGRGAAVADIDGDGDLDLLITVNGGPPRLLRNDGGNKNHWLRVVLEGDGVHSNRSAIGATVELKVGDKTQRQELMGGRSYLSQSELVLTFGLGDAREIDELTVTWPGGGQQTLEKIQANQVLHIRQDGQRGN